MNKKELITLIDKAGELDLQIKKLQEEFKGIKEKIQSSQLTDSEKEKINKMVLSEEKVHPIKLQGSKFIESISIIPTYTDIDPVLVFNYMAKVGKSERIPDVLKVQITPVTKILGEETVKGFREIIGFSTKSSFKEIK